MVWELAALILQLVLYGTILYLCNWLLQPLDFILRIPRHPETFMTKAQGSQSAKHWIQTNAFSGLKANQARF